MSIEDIRARAEKASEVTPRNLYLPSGQPVLEALADIPKLLAALEAVLDAHREIQCLDEDGEETGATACANCKDHDDLSGERVHEVWPCFTVKEIERAMAGERTMADLRQSFIEALL